MEKIENILDRLTAMIEQPYAKTFKELKKSGKKLIGCVPMHVPEELIDAAGMIPVLIMESKEPITLGHNYAPVYFCSPVRVITDMAVKGQLTDLDGMVVPDTCHEMRGMSDVMKRHSGIDWFRGIYLPSGLNSPHHKTQLIRNLQELRASLAEFASSRAISDESLRTSISIFNKNRKVMAKLYDLRRRKPSLINSKQMATIAVAGTLMSKGSHNAILEQLIASLESAKVSNTERANGGVPLILSGSFCEPPRRQILDLIDEVGGRIVDDDLYTGSRYFSTLVSEKGDPLEALADAFIKRIPPCPTRYRLDDDWGDYLAKMASRSGAKGVISIVVKYCEPHLYYRPYLVRTLSASGLVEFMIETEAETTELAPLRTRLQALIEMLARK